MKAKLNLYTILLTIFMTMAIQSVCHANNTLTFGGVSKIAPFSSKENGIAKGFLIDVFRQVAQRAGFQLDIQLYPFKRLNKYLQEGHIDGAISIFYKQERESYLIFSAHPVLVSRTLVFVKKGKEFRFNSIGDLYGKKIGMMAGWTVKNQRFDTAVAQGEIKIHGGKNYGQNIKKLMLGRVDCIISTEHLTWYHANRMNVAEEIVALDKKIDDNLTFIAVSKKSTNIDDIQSFMEKFNAAHIQFINDGTYETILKKYGLIDIK